jgi:hypothetical protein
VAVDLNECAAEAARRARKIAQHHVRRACRMIAVPGMLRRDRISVPPKIVVAAREVMPAEVKWDVPKRVFGLDPNLLRL